MENLPPPIADAPTLEAVSPPAGSPDAARRAAGVASAAPAAQPAPQAARPLAAALDFVDREGREVPLAFPFVLDGRRIEQITVRRLVTAQVAVLCADGKVPDPFEAYSAMTGLPAPVLRGLDGDDGQAVAEAAFDFLPRLLRAAFSG